MAKTRRNINAGSIPWSGKGFFPPESAFSAHSEHRFPAPSSEEGCRKPVLGVCFQCKLSYGVPAAAVCNRMRYNSLAEGTELNDGCTQHMKMKLL